MVLKKALFSPREGAEIASILSAEHLPIPTVAVILNESRLTLAKWRLQGEGPPFMRLKRGVIVYPRDALGRYLSSRHKVEINADSKVFGSKKQIDRRISR